MIVDLELGIVPTTRGKEEKDDLLYNMSGAGDNGSDSTPWSEVMPMLLLAAVVLSICFLWMLSL